MGVRADCARVVNPLEENQMADRDSNLGSDESRNPDLGRDEDSGMSGSGSSSDRDSDLGSSRDSGTSRDENSTGGSGSDRDIDSDEIGSDNVSNR